MPVLELAFDLEAPGAEAASDACFAAGALSVTLCEAREGENAVLEPAPGEVRLWPAIRLRALFPGEAGAATARRAVADALGLDPSTLDTRLIADRVWELEWREHFHAMRFGRRLWVAPSHETVADTDAVVVRLDPGLAFGTGTHPTTAMCLEWLDAHLARGERVIDYGCGSGILALAAAKLGAARVECFDIDPQALAATAEGAAANGLADRVIVVHGAEELSRDADVLIANILAGPLRELAPRFAALVRASGRIVLSGLLEHEAVEVTETYRAWFDMRRFEVREPWAALAGARHPRAE